MFSDQELTKAGLLAYYRKISHWIIPFLKNRPLVLHRYPDGIEGDNFYQKDIPEYFPDWIDRIDVALREGGQQTLVNCNRESTLLYLVNQGVVTPHVWLSKKGRLEYPDRLILDLDPPEGGFRLVQEAARDLMKLFDRMGMRLFVMTSGSRGMHLQLPLDGKSEFDETRDFAQKAAEKLVAAHPEKYTVEPRKDQREGKLFIDYLRNSYGQTGVAPYSLRARQGAPAATPLDRKEAVSAGMRPDRYNHENLFRRLGQKEDPWAEIDKHGYSVEKGLAEIDKIGL